MLALFKAASRDRVIRAREFEAAIRGYLAVSKEQPKPFVWTKSADEILATIARFCRRTSDSGHSRS